MTEKDGEGWDGCRCLPSLPSIDLRCFRHRTGLDEKTRQSYSISFGKTTSFQRYFEKKNHLYLFKSVRRKTECDYESFDRKVTTTSGVYTPVGDDVSLENDSGPVVSPFIGYVN